jgi:uncharacterized protein (DUF1778 family)
MQASKTARFDTRWTREQKEFFEYASRLSGFRTLSEFVFSSVQERAKKIVKEHNMILASNRDKMIFFDALMNPQMPNKKLQKAASKYKETFGE